MSLPLPPKVTNLSGRTFGRLTVREFAGVRDGFAYWFCDCLCGTRKEVRGKSLVAWEKAGRAISCGCYRAESLVRKEARLTMSEEDRHAAASGLKVTPPRPEPVPRAPRKKREIVLGPPEPRRSLLPPKFYITLIQEKRPPGHKTYYRAALRKTLESQPLFLTRQQHDPSTARREAERLFGALEWIMDGLVSEVR